MTAQTYKLERDSAWGAIELQNQSVQAWKSDADSFKAKVDTSQKAANAVAAEVRKTLAEISKQPIPADCSGAVNVARQFMAVPQ